MPRDALDLRAGCGAANWRHGRWEAAGAGWTNHLAAVWDFGHLPGPRIEPARPSRSLDKSPAPFLASCREAEGAGAPKCLWRGGLASEPTLAVVRTRGTLG